MVEDSILYYQSMKESIPWRWPSVEESLESIPTFCQICIIWVPVCRSCRCGHSVLVPLRECENITYITWNLKIITIWIVLQWFSDYSCLQNRWDEFQTMLKICGNILLFFIYRVFKIKNNNKFNFRNTLNEQLKCNDGEQICHIATIQ